MTIYRLISFCERAAFPFVAVVLFLGALVLSGCEADDTMTEEFAKPPFDSQSLAQGRQAWVNPQEIAVEWETGNRRAMAMAVAEAERSRPIRFGGEASQSEELIIAKPPFDSVAAATLAQGRQAAEPTGVVSWPFVRVDTKQRCVEIDGFVSTTEGWLEQIVCNIGTRDYEAVVATAAKASHVHAGLLLLGLEAGHPGAWKIDPDDPQGMKWAVVQPEGSKVWVRVQWTDANGQTQNVDVQDWVRDHHTGNQFPDGPWVFGGSVTRSKPDGRNVYVADSSGSICGLVTFGDETLGWNEVWPDQIELMPAEWEADTEAMPPQGTRVVVRLLVEEP